MIGLLGVHKLQFGQYFKDYSLLFPWPFLRQALIESEQNDSLFISNFFLSLLLFTVNYLRWFVNSGGPIEFQPFPEYFLLANTITCKVRNDVKELTAVNFLKVFLYSDYWTSCKKKLFRWNPKMALLTKGPEHAIEEGFSIFFKLFGCHFH